MKSIDASILVLRDSNEATIDTAYHGISLALSNDDNIYYNDLFNHAEFNDDTLTLWDYNGRVYIPRHTGICIFDTLKKVSGTIASPTHIDAKNDVILRILKDSNLELCLATNGDFFLNGELKARAENPEYYYGETTFEDLANKYNDIFGKGHKYDSKNFIMNVCLHYNILDIECIGHPVSLEYEHPINGSRTERVLNNYKNFRIKLERELSHAIRREDYMIAAEKKRGLDIINDKIIELTSELAVVKKY